ncbi:MAG: GNAT family N-acetyltransferase [Actinomycetota bacterium]|nr:GNAT family N-acetyltransferase [Actinomycetota bacterium]
MEIRALGVADLVPLAALFGRVPEGDLTFVKEDIFDPGTVAAWPRDRRGRRFVALDEGEVVGYLAIVPGVGWCSHVGEVRVVVDPLRRRHGIGGELAQRALEEADALGMGKLVIEVPADQRFATELFERLGFAMEARLSKHLRDAAGRFHDLVLLACALDQGMTADLREESPTEEAGTGETATAETIDHEEETASRDTSSAEEADEREAADGPAEEEPPRASSQRSSESDDAEASPDNR